MKALFRRDLLVTQKSDPKYAERLKRAICTRFIDTNEFSLSDVPRDERLLIGARTTGRLGARHNPEVARQALEESKSEVDALLSGYSVVIVIGTGGKGTGAGTMFPVVQMARQHKCLVIPIFVRPSFERHEVDKRRFDHALSVIDQFDKAQIRFIEILNNQGYADRHPEPQSVVWERMTLPIARGLRGLIYVLSDLSQVDPSDLSTLVAGPGRIRIGFAEINPPASQDPDGQQIEDAVRTCWQNSYYAFGKPVGTSLVCIQGEWSNVVDAGIKGRLAALASGDAEGHPYTSALRPGAPHAEAVGRDRAVRRVPPATTRLWRLIGIWKAESRLSSAVKSAHMNPPPASSRPSHRKFPFFDALFMTSGRRSMTKTSPNLRSRAFGNSR